MTLLEDARRLADANPYTLDRAACQFCYQVQDREHFPGCPWLALPKILAALEAAQGVVDSFYDNVLEDREVLDEIKTLAPFFRQSEVAPSGDHLTGTD